MEISLFLQCLRNVSLSENFTKCFTYSLEICLRNVDVVNKTNVIEHHSRLKRYVLNNF